MGGSALADLIGRSGNLPLAGDLADLPQPIVSVLSPALFYALPDSMGSFSPVICAKILDLSWSILCRIRVNYCNV